MKNKPSLFQTSAARAALMVTAPWLVVAAGKLNAQVSYPTQGSLYSQNFDGLFSVVPTNNTITAGAILPAGWSFLEAGANANTTLRVDPGTQGTGDTYLFGATASNERAFGSYASGSLSNQFGIQLINNSGSTINSFTITYDGEQWKDGGSGTAVFNKLTFSYAFGAASLTNGTYQNTTALDFTALVNNTSADAAKDGNNASFRTAGITTTISDPWTAGTSLWLRWSDLNETGNDDGLAIDNFSLTTPVPEPRVLAFLGLGLTAWWGLRRRDRK